MSINIPHPANPSQQLSRTEVRQLSWLLIALALEEEETLRINRLEVPPIRHVGLPARTHFSQLDDQAFLEFRTFDGMTPGTAIQTIYLTFLLGYVDIRTPEGRPTH